jgi:hypothetical protein
VYCHANFKKDPEIAAHAFLGDHFLLEEIPADTFKLPEFWAIVLHVRHDYIMLCPEMCLSSEEFWVKLLKIDDALISLCPAEILSRKDFRKALGL